jgi:hypothetical protein
VPVEVVGSDRAALGIIQIAIRRDTSIVDEDVDLKFSRGTEMLLRSVENGGCGFFGLA